MTHDIRDTIHEEIPIFFTTDDQYIPFLDVAISSLISNASTAYTYRIIILNTGIKQENIDLVKRAEREGFSEKAMAAYETRKAQNRKDLKRVLSLPSVFDTMVENTTVSVCADQVIEGFNKD